MHNFFGDTDNTEVLELLEPDSETGSGRRQTYVPGEVNTFTHTTPDGDELTGYITFEAARVIRLAARVQMAKRGKMLVVTQGIVVDSPEIGVIIDGQQIPHPLFNEPRYANWAADSRPKRLNAQQWVLAENRDKVQAYADALQERGFSVIVNPSNQAGSQRRTTDLFRLQPSTPYSPADPTNYGVPVDAFEVNVNPSYESGFSDFLTGVEEQRQRWEQAAKLDGAERQVYLKEISRNVHFLSGIYHADAQKTWWARPIDVSSVTLGGTAYPLYNLGGAKLDASVFDVLDTPVAPAPAGGEGNPVPDAGDPVLAAHQASLRQKVLDAQAAVSAESQA